MPFKIAVLTKPNTATLIALLACCVLATPASAASQKDIQACRTAIAQHGAYDISTYRLRYLSHKGRKDLTIKLEAIPNKSGERFKLTCQLNRKRKVVAINEQSLSKLAHIAD